MGVFPSLGLLAAIGRQPALSAEFHLCLKRSEKERALGRILPHACQPLIMILCGFLVNTRCKMRGRLSIYERIEAIRISLPGPKRISIGFFHSAQLIHFEVREKPIQSKGK